MRRVAILSFKFVLCFTVATTAFGKSKPDPTKALLLSGLERYEQGQYFEAISFYEEVLSLDSTQHEAHYYLGDCYRYLFKYELAFVHYQQIKPDKASLYPMLEMNLGLVHKSLGNYDQAKDHFQSFIRTEKKKNNPEQNYWLNRATTELQNLKKVLQAPFSPVYDIQVSRLPAPVNSPSHDLAAVPYLNSNSSIVITSTRVESKGNSYHDQHGESFSDNLLFSLDSDAWQPHSNLNGFSVVNSTLDEGPGAFSSDGLTYYFTRFSKGDYHLFVSNFKGGRWQYPDPLPEPVNLPGFVSKHPALSSTGDTLFFSSDRPGGYGESDLWMSVRQQNEWQKPINLGATVNTPYQETSPNWNANNRVLFFASNGHPGWGGFDLFLTAVLPAHFPNEVINLGKPLNSEKDDTYIHLIDTTGYLTSNRDGTSGNFNIFKYQYSNESKPLLSLNNLSIWERWANQLHFQSSREKALEENQVFSALPPHEQQLLKRVLKRRIFRALNAETVLTETALEEAHMLLNLHGNKLQTLIDDQLNFYWNFQIPSWDDETRRWFAGLDPEEQLRIERANHILVLETLLQSDDDSPNCEAFAYESLPSEQRLWIDVATERGVRNFQETTEGMIGLATFFQWQTLEPEEKEELQRELNRRRFSSIALTDEPSEVIQHQYEQLPPEEQQQIERLAYALVFGEKGSDSLALAESAFMLDTLPAEEQYTLARLVVHRSQELKREYDTEISADTYVWEKLPGEAKTTINRAVNARKFVAETISDISLSDEPQPHINLHSLLTANPDLVTVKGKLSVSNTANEPIEVSLKTSKQQLTTITQPGGSFTFERVNYQNSPQLYIGGEENEMPEILSLSLEELEIIVVQDSQFVEPFDNIYFETSKHQLTKKADQILDRVAKFHQSNPDITIQIHAYADSVGSQSFNYQLSRLRGESVYKSLIQRGVSTDAVVVVPKGKENLSTSRALSFSRRVEFVITGINTVYNPTREIYLLSANPDLNKIASRYRISLDELLKQNPGISSQPLPYTIVNVTTNQVK
jgi:outer membrane protein OmpA-like peptidoglycan-associated protein/tetratricopeptide (TPR) repeat protein